MTPQNFADRMVVLISTTKDEPRVRDVLAFDLMLETLAENGFHEGAATLVNAMPEKIRPAHVAQAVERSRHG